MRKLLKMKGANLWVSSSCAALRAAKAEPAGRVRTLAGRRRSWEADVSPLLELRRDAVAEQAGALTLNMRHYNMAVNSNRGGTSLRAVSNGRIVVGTQVPGDHPSGRPSRKAEKTMRPVKLGHS